MDSKVIKVNETDIKGMELKGNFLYEENGEYYFTDKFNHSLFILGKENNAESRVMTFDQYVAKFLEVCANVKNKPSLLFLNYVPNNFLNILNKTQHNYKVLDLQENNVEENFSTLNSMPTISYIETDFISVLKKLVEKRNGSLQNDVFVFFNEPEYSHNLRNPGLDTIITVSQSRRIYFVLNFVDKDKYIANYGLEAYQNIENNCKRKFMYSHE